MIVIEREREREAETQAEGEAGSMQGARRGIRSRFSRITPRAAGGTKLLRHWGCLHLSFFLVVLGRRVNLVPDTLLVRNGSP